MCDGDPEDREWSCLARATFRIKKQDRQGEDLSDQIDESLFNERDKSWGCKDFIDLKALPFFNCLFLLFFLQTLLDPANGWLDSDGALHLQAEVDTYRKPPITIGI
jgi:hypothetical protein